MSDFEEELNFRLHSLTEDKARVVVKNLKDLYRITINDLVAELNRHLDEEDPAASYKAFCCSQAASRVANTFSTFLMGQLSADVGKIRALLTVVANQDYHPEADDAWEKRALSIFDEVN